MYVDGNAVLVDSGDSGDYGVTRQWTVDNQDKVQNYQDKVRNNEARIFYFKISHRSCEHITPVTIILYHHSSNYL